MIDIVLGELLNSIETSVGKQRKILYQLSEIFDALK